MGSIQFNKEVGTMSADDAVKKDAAEFGAHMKAGGWRLALLVARNVEKGKGNGENQHTREGVPIGTPSGKVSANEFAELSGVGKNRVGRYLTAWNNAANDGVVPHSSTLEPGIEVDLNVDELPAWTDYYNGYTSNTEKHQRYTDAAEQYGTTANSIHRTTQNKAATRAAIQADDDFAEAMAEALRERHQREYEEHRSKLADAELNAVSSGGRIPTNEEINDRMRRPLDAYADAALDEQQRRDAIAYLEKAASHVASFGFFGVREEVERIDTVLKTLSSIIVTGVTTNE